jgi:signal transduction histidine kinase
LEKEKQRNALIQAERISSLTTMVAGMAHEINTPVGVSVTANSCVEELLKTLNDDYETGKLTESKFHKSIKEMDNMNKMLASNLRRTATLIESFKQVSVNQSIDKIQKVNIKNYIEQIWMSLTPLTKSSNITFTLNCDSMLEASIYTGALSQIITNLVTNAVSHAFIDINKPSITLSVKELANNECKMSFQDNGNGIPADNVVHIFDPFFTTKRGHGGTGLGLHILHNLVTDKLHGRVICTSEVNVGTSFDIFFSKEGKE